MKMTILLSIKPEFAEKILNGEKRYEFRKSVPKTSKVDKVVLYATMPVGKVIGEFTIDDILFDHPESIWNETRNFAGISKIFFSEYFKGRNIAYAIKVKDALRYEQPKELSEVSGSNQPPQSFCYI